MEKSKNDNSIPTRFNFFEHSSSSLFLYWKTCPGVQRISQSFAFYDCSAAEVEGIIKEFSNGKASDLPVQPL